MGRRKIPVEVRFWWYVDKTQGFGPEGTCWEWTSTIEKTGYGSLNVDYKPRKAHRISWELNYGKIPDGLLVLHKCDNRKCVNPNHLFIGTHLDNMRDMIQKGRKNVVKGERQHASKLTSEQVREIRKSEKNDQELADQYKVGRTAITKIKMRITWKHVI